MQPTLRPCDSPYVDTRKYWPKVDMLTVVRVFSNVREVVGGVVGESNGSGVVKGKNERLWR